MNVGDRIRLISCSDPYITIPRGTEGTVTHIDGITRIVSVDFDNGMHIGLMPGVDRWETIAPKASDNA